MNIESKMFEIRDRGTFIPALALKARDISEQESFLYRRCGYLNPSYYVILIQLNTKRCEYDFNEWGGRTMPVAHEYIHNNFDTLTSGEVIDVEFILAEKPTKKISEREDRIYG